MNVHIYKCYIDKRIYIEFVSGIGENNDDSIPQHDNLKNFSPLTLILSSRHRRGDHRGCGDIFKALLSMQKFNVIIRIEKKIEKLNQCFFCRFYKT